MIRTFDTIVTPGRIRTRIVAGLDAATFSDAVSWPQEFGSDPDHVLDVLAGPIDGSVPAIGIRVRCPSTVERSG